MIEVCVQLDDMTRLKRSFGNNTTKLYTLHKDTAQPAGGGMTGELPDKNVAVLLYNIIGIKLEPITLLKKLNVTAAW